MENRTFTAPLIIPAGTSPGTYEVKTKLDSQYKRATGVVAYVNNDGGLPSFQLGLRSDAQVYVSPTNASYLMAGLDCPKAQRLTPVNILCDNTNITIQVVVPALLASDLNVDMVFMLERPDRAY